MRTAVVSDLHLGVLADADVAREDKPLAALAEAVSDADRLVLLGDIVELRERPLAQALEVSRPVLEALGRAMAGRPVVLVPGNHDHALAEPWLARLRLDGRATAGGGGVAGRARRWRGRAHLRVDAGRGADARLSRPAAARRRLRDARPLPRPAPDHAAARVDRRVRDGTAHEARPEAGSAADYETILAPLYAFYAGLAQGASAAALARGSSFSRTVWQRASDGRAADAPADEAPATRERAAAAATRFLLGGSRSRARWPR